MNTIRSEIRRKRGHMPIRKLFKAAGETLQRIKPVMLMSPISVAQFLPPGSVEFDLLSSTKRAKYALKMLSASSPAPSRSSSSATISNCRLPPSSIASWLTKKSRTIATKLLTLRSLALPKPPILKAFWRSAKRAD